MFNVVLALRIVGYVLTAAGAGVGVVAKTKQENINNKKRLDADKKAREDIYKRLDKLEGKES